MRLAVESGDLAFALFFLEAINILKENWIYLSQNIVVIIIITAIIIIIIINRKSIWILESYRI